MPERQGAMQPLARREWLFAGAVPALGQLQQAKELCWSVGAMNSCVSLVPTRGIEPRTY